MSRDLALLLNDLMKLICYSISIVYIIFDISLAIINETLMKTRGKFADLIEPSILYLFAAPSVPVLVLFDPPHL